jgi:hypothetical protein
MAVFSRGAASDSSPLLPIIGAIAVGKRPQTIQAPDRAKEPSANPALDQRPSAID